MAIYIKNIVYEHRDILTKNGRGYVIGYTSCEYEVHFGTLILKGYTGFDGDLTRNELIESILEFIDDNYDKH